MTDIQINYIDSTACTLYCIHQENIRLIGMLPSVAVLHVFRVVGASSSLIHLVKATGGGGGEGVVNRAIIWQTSARSGILSTFQIWMVKLHWRGGMKIVFFLFGYLDIEP